MIRKALSELVRSTLRDLLESGDLPEHAARTPEIADTKQADHGHYATNVAMVEAKGFGTNPRELATKLAERLRAHDDVFARIDIAGPGFINFFLHPAYLAGFLPAMAELGEEGIARSHEESRRINVEFVSVNPNGPITIGSGRGAAYGSALCNVLEAVGNEVHREYYINDGVNSEQMRLFALSVQSFIQKIPFPEKGYRGDYVQEVAEQLRSDPEAVTANTDWYQAKSQALMIEAQRRALSEFGVEFDCWFSEQSLHDAGIVARDIETLKAQGVADTVPERIQLKLGKGGKVEEVNREAQAAVLDENDADGEGETLWLRSTRFGDDMDRVLRRRDGRLTYIASDVAYHKDKFNRPANSDQLITILGPDHHGYIGRLTSVVAALLLSEGKVQEQVSEAPFTDVDAQLYGDAVTRDRCQAAQRLAEEKLRVQIYQLVRFMKDGKPAPMRQRDGNIYALADLVREIGEKALTDGTPEERAALGRDVARFFYLMRSHDTTFDFDLDLAEKQSDENPVFYVQYAHARICSIIDRAKQEGFTPEFVHGQLMEPQEMALLMKVSDLSWEVQRCAQDFGIHRISTYVIELARSYHSFYDACRVIQPDSPELTRARLALCQLTGTALKAGLGLLGVSAPQRM